MIQTDNPEQLVSWLASRKQGREEHGDQGRWPSLPKGSVRVQAEDYSSWVRLACHVTSLVTVVLRGGTTSWAIAVLSAYPRARACRRCG